MIRGDRRRREPDATVSAAGRPKREHRSAQSEGTPMSPHAPPDDPGRRFDLVTMGRAIVDVYGEQVGCRLEDVSSFAKYVGGCPANIAIGAARLGLRVAMITRVGDEQHGRFIRESLARERVD